MRLFDLVEEDDGVGLPPDPLRELPSLLVPDVAGGRADQLGDGVLLQVITYLRLSQLPVGLLVNFNVTALRNGLRGLTPAPPNSSALPPFL